VQTVTTSDETLEMAFGVGEKLGKTTVHATGRTSAGLSGLTLARVLTGSRRALRGHQGFVASARSGSAATEQSGYA